LDILAHQFAHDMQVSFDLNGGRNGASVIDRSTDSPTLANLRSGLESAPSDKSPRKPPRRATEDSVNAFSDGFEECLNCIAQSKSPPAAAVFGFPSSSERAIASDLCATGTTSILASTSAQETNSKIKPGESTFPSGSHFDSSIYSTPVLKSADVQTHGIPLHSDETVAWWTNPPSMPAPVRADTPLQLSGKGEEALGEPSANFQSIMADAVSQSHDEQIVLNSAEQVTLNSAAIERSRSHLVGDYVHLRSGPAPSHTGVTREQHGSEGNLVDAIEPTLDENDLNLATRSFELPANQDTSKDQRHVTAWNGEREMRLRQAAVQEPGGASNAAQASGCVADVEWPTHGHRDVAGPARELPDIATQIAREVVSRAESAVQQGRAEFSMRLEPPELGTVRVHLTATEHAVSARVVVASEAVQQVVESQLSSLRQSLADAGMSLERFDISHGGQESRHEQSYHEPWRAMAPQDDGWKLRPPTMPRVTSVLVPPGRIDVMV
jgi:plasmid stabilization system protein ParE